MALLSECMQNTGVEETVVPLEGQKVKLNKNALANPDRTDCHSSVFQSPNAHTLYQQMSDIKNQGRDVLSVLNNQFTHLIFLIYHHVRADISLAIARNSIESITSPSNNLIWKKT